MRKNKVLLLVSSLGALLLLFVAAYQEHFGQEWRQIQRRALSEDGPIEVQLRQIVNPDLGVSDRCVSCHVTMSGGEQDVTGLPVLSPHGPVVHDPIEFGCTVCHGGQGAATEKEAAHGNVEFWHQPMIPLSMSEAGCGSCHVPLGVPSRERLQEARAAFERLECLACHRVDGGGGTLPASSFMEVPDLSYAGIAGYDADWHQEHVDNRNRAMGGPWVGSFSEVMAADLGLLEIYLGSRGAVPDLVEARAVFHSAGCLGCHKVNGAGGEEGPDLTRVAQTEAGRFDLESAPDGSTSSNWFTDHFPPPGADGDDSGMPAPDLSEDDLRLLTMYLLSLRGRDVPGSYMPRDRVRATQFAEREFASDGATLFSAFCSGCHGSQGEGQQPAGQPVFPSIANPDFLNHAPLALISETVRRGRPGRRMPAWDGPGGLRSAEIDSVVSYLRTLVDATGPTDTRPARWLSGDIETGRRVYEATCSGCHGAQGEGGEGPALDNPVLRTNATDSYLVETIAGGRRGTNMAAFAEPSPTRPALTTSEIESVATYIRSW